MQLLDDKIASISFKIVKDDVIRFIQNDKELDIWSTDYFKDLAEKITFK